MVKITYVIFYIKIRTFAIRKILEHFVVSCRNYAISINSNQIREICSFLKPYLFFIQLF